MRNITPESSVPYGYCQCGCGQKTAISRSNCKRFRQVKGQPRRFVQWHHHKWRGQHTPEFWSRVDKRGEDECWNWTGKAHHAFGYGVLTIGGKYVSSHRRAYELSYGPIPPKMSVLHKCDNPQCCNPTHLYLGTEADNARDRKLHHRNANRHGSKNPQAKLLESQIPTIRRLASSGLSNRKIAGQFGVSHSAINCIVRGETWVHV